MDRLLPWLRRSGWAYALAAVALALVAWRLGPGSGGGGGQPAAAEGPAETPTAPVQVDGPPAAPSLVHVAGEVRRPGVYRVAAGARAIEAIRRAGGATRRADLSGLNLAAPLQDGQQVLIPARAPRAPAGAVAAAGTGPAAAGTISLSSATAQDLEALDGIGPTLAARIVEWRTTHGGFASVDQLLEVPGIGPARLEALRARVTP
jgi:competence protein ComEA